MTKSQKATLAVFEKAAAAAGWEMEYNTIAAGDLSIMVKAPKWYQDSIMGRIGKRGAFYQWKLTEEYSTKETRQNARIIAEVYIR